MQDDRSINCAGCPYIRNGSVSNPASPGYHLIQAMGSLFQPTSIVHPLLTFRLLPVNSSIETATDPNEMFTNAIEKTTTSTPTESLMPTRSDISSMITSIPSFSALRDYMKLIVLGGAFEGLRRLYSASYSSIVKRFFITASFESEDDAYRGYLFLHGLSPS
jgi:hypothetical protein